MSVSDQAMIGARTQARFRPPVRSSLGGTAGTTLEGACRWRRRPPWPTLAVTRCSSTHEPPRFRPRIMLRSSGGAPSAGCCVPSERNLAIDRLVILRPVPLDFTVHRAVLGCPLGSSAIMAAERNPLKKHTPTQTIGASVPRHRPTRPSCRLATGPPFPIEAQVAPPNRNECGNRTAAEKP